MKGLGQWPKSAKVTKYISVFLTFSTTKSKRLCNFAKCISDTFNLDNGFSG